MACTRVGFCCCVCVLLFAERTLSCLCRSCLTSTPAAIRQLNPTLFATIDTACWALPGSLCGYVDHSYRMLSQQSHFGATFTLEPHFHTWGATHRLSRTVRVIIMTDTMPWMACCSALSGPRKRHRQLFCRMLWCGWSQCVDELSSRCCIA